MPARASEDRAQRTATSRTGCGVEAEGYLLGKELRYTSLRRP